MISPVRQHGQSCISWAPFLLRDYYTKASRLRSLFHTSVRRVASLVVGARRSLSTNKGVSTMSLWVGLRLRN